MSQTVLVSFRDTRAWAHDVALSILFAETAAIIEGALDADDGPGWLAGVSRSLRRAAAFGPHQACDLEFGLDAQRHAHLLGLMSEAALRLAHRGPVTRDEALRWRVLDDMTIRWRGAGPFDTGRLGQLVDDLRRLADGTLPPPPPDTMWFFGDPDGLTTIPMRRVSRA